MLQFISNKLSYYSSHKVLALIMSIKLIITDQITKSYFVHLLPQVDLEEITVHKYLRITYAWNHGISFGLFDYHTNNALFLVINMIIIIYVLYCIAMHTGLLLYGYILIAAGGISNIIDRILYGAVFDFIDIHIVIFNLADIYILLGFLLIVVKYTKDSSSLKLGK